MLTRLSRRAALSGLAVSAVPAHRARAGRRLVRLAEAIGADTAIGIGCRAFAQAVDNDALLSNVLQVMVFDDGELGEDMPSLRGCLHGSLDMVVTGTAQIATVQPIISVLDTPFLFKDTATARAKLDGDIGREFIRLLKQKGANVLAWGESGVRHMTANKPIRRPEDLSGLKLRVPQSEVMVSGFRALGADARSSPLGLLHEALRTGDFEAEENPIGNIESLQLYEVQKFISLTGHVYSAAVFVASQDLVDDLTPEQNAALAACARQGAAAMRKAADAAERDGLSRLREKGMVVVTDLDRDAFAAAARPNLLAMGKKFGEELLRSLAGI
jgi:tripartite ATP-independent transporter DctP family solute receptor